MTTVTHHHPSPLVGIVMGSRSDWPCMKKAADILNALDIPFEASVMSAHRTPGRVHDYITSAKGRGIRVIIGAAGGAAHLAGVCASLTTLPVIGIPMKTSALGGMDSLLSTVQMPKGIPVATMGIGDSGAINGALFAAALCAHVDSGIEERLSAYREEMSKAVPLTVED
jgi:5-(carboxyamino)imidazole ribonucleotide mutase